jgi:hypothetical protein
LYGQALLQNAIEKAGPFGERVIRESNKREQAALLADMAAGSKLVDFSSIQMNIDILRINSEWGKLWF